MVRHRRDALVGHPLVVPAAVPRRVRVVPSVRRVGQEGLAEVLYVGSERQQLAGAVGLVQHRLLPDGSVTGCGSAKPRTPRRVPK